MKHLAYIAIIAGACLFSSCIKDEAKNASADIEGLYFNPDDHVSMITKPVITNSSVMILLPKGQDRTMLKPYFWLSQGARISPVSGTEMDFSQAQEYTVTSEDGKWSKKYSVRVSSDDLASKYDFERYDRGKYDIFYEEVWDDNNEAQRQDIWASGNSAFGILFGSAPPEDYPTAAAPGEGRSGFNMTAAKLVTRSLQPLGGIVGKPIAAGNLFIGEFSGSLFGDPLKMTKFGLPVTKKPLKLKGWYKYKPEAKDVNGNDFDDECRIYAVFYKSEDGTKLDGSNIMTSPNIVAKAIFESPVATDEWKPYENNPGDGEILFEYGDNEVDENDLAANKYYLTVVFTSSRYGDEFKGSIGSTLLVDEVEVIFEE